MAAKGRSLALGLSIVGVCVLAFALASGFLYEHAGRARDRELFPQIGRSVDIGGRTLNIYCSGVGQPAVVFESGATWPFIKNPKAIFENGGPRPGYSWVSIQRELARFSTACWYDRAGSGWSDLGPYPRDSAAQARDLHAVLQAAGVPPPYVLVAESSAALDAHVYAGLYPPEVAGLVLVNGVHPDLIIRTRPGLARIPRFVSHSQDVAAQIFNQIGLYRLGLARRPVPAPPPPPGMASSEWNTIWRLTQAPNARAALLQDISSWERSTVQARAAGSLGDRPLIVVSSDTAMASENHDLWMELETDLAGLSAQGKSVVIDASSADLIYYAPSAIVGAVRQVLDDVRKLQRPELAGVCGAARRQ
jgi:pimeloyl-ACP methyl ester carboxylesterase